MQLFRLEKPTFSENKAKEVFDRIQTDAELRAFIDSANEPEYLYWDKMKYKSPIPTGFNHEQAWFAVQIARLFRYQPSPVKVFGEGAFQWVRLRGFEKFCHEFDLNTGGELATSIDDLKPEEQQRLISKGVMDEAIASSQLEGADTGREYARKMLREGIKPRNQSDQMILNNHKAMIAVDSEYKSQELTRDLLIEMHRMLTDKTLDSEGREPQWRPDGELVEVHDSEFVYHKGPATEFVNTEIKRFIEFANDRGEGDFIHPIIKAIMLHFWIGYLHPFTDGNGRLARLIFYWYLLKKKYWAFSYLPLSAVIKRSKKSYTMAYVYSEQDNYDLTYFISYQMKKIREASSGFQEYLSEIRKSNREMTRIARGSLNLNERQIQTLRYLSGNSDDYSTVKTHGSIYRISKATAIKDLRILTEKGFLKKKKVGKNSYFYGTEKIDSLFVKE